MSVLSHDFVRLCKHICSQSTKITQMDQNFSYGTVIRDPRNVCVIRTACYCAHACKNILLQKDEKNWAKQCMVQHQNHSEFSYFCGASLINHKWLLTARHCMIKFLPHSCAKVSILFGESTVSWHRNIILSFLYQASPGAYECERYDVKLNLIASLGITHLSYVTYEDAHAFGSLNAQLITFKY